MSGFDDPYLIPGTDCLRNKLGITDAATLDRVERLYTTQRAAEGVPGGQFDLPHLQSIHRHLFQDVYDWAGELRTRDIAKGSSHFMPHDLIERGMDDVHRRLEKTNFLRGLDRDGFAAGAGRIIGDVNHVHPFRDGNGRTQLLFLERLGHQAGHPVDLKKLDPKAWIEASQAAHDGDYGLIGRQIGGCIVQPQREKPQPERPKKTPYRGR